MNTLAAFTAFGVAVGVAVAHVRALRMGLDGGRLNSFLIWILVGAILGGHFAHALWYETAPPQDWQDNSRMHAFAELFKFWHGWRSIGGFFGAIFAGTLWRWYDFKSAVWIELDDVLTIEGYRFVRRRQPESVFALADVVASVFPLGWLFHATGSTLVHNHPGVRAASLTLLAVRFPDAASNMTGALSIMTPAVARYDLGFFEMLLTGALATSVFILRKRFAVTGMYVAIIGITYPPARFALDFLRRHRGPGADPRYGSLTPAQWGCLLLFCMALAVLWRICRSSSQSAACPRL